MSDNTPMTFDDLDVSGVAAAPVYMGVPSGSYIVTVSLNQKLIGDKKTRAVEMVMNLEEVIEIGNQHQDLPTNPGQIFTKLNFITSPDSLGYIKRDLGALFEATGTTSVNTLVAAVQNLRCKVLVNYDAKDYMQIPSIEVI